MTKARTLASIAAASNNNATVSALINTGTVTVPTSTDTLVGRATTDTLTNKTITLPFITSPTENFLAGTYSGGTVNFDLKAYGFSYSSSSSTANITVNLRGDVSTTLNSLLAVGQSITFSCIVNNGGTPYYISAVQVDGSSVTPKWSGGTAPSAGNASSLDIYSFTVMKTAATPTYIVLAAGPVKYA